MAHDAGTRSARINDRLDYLEAVVSLHVPEL